MYLLTYAGNSEILGSWESVVNHPQFLSGSVAEWSPGLGWVEI
jgi:hypothetical protein